MTRICSFGCYLHHELYYQVICVKWARNRSNELYYSIFDSNCHATKPLSHLAGTCLTSFGIPFARGPLSAGVGKGGSIILAGSSAGTTGSPAFGAYSASKAAVRNLARTWAEELKGTGIRVNVLSPGPTATELAKEELGEEGMKAVASMIPLQRMAEPTEIGAAAAFLASSDSSFMTASELAVDGGLAQL